eukprot:g19776.t1
MSTLRPRSPEANAKKTYIFGYLGVTLLISFQGQLLVLDYLHHGPFKESGTWAETSMMIVGSVQCSAGPLFTLLQKRFHEQHCSLLRYLFHLAACCLLMCNIVFLVLLVASSGQRAAMLDSDKEHDDILVPDGGANHGHEQTTGPEEEDEALQLHCAYFALFLLGLGQNFMRGCVLAKAATSTTPESSQHAFSRGVALSGLPGLVFMWLFPRPDGAMALGHEVDQESPVGRGVWAVFWKTRRVVIGVFLLFTSLHLVWPALPLAIWPRPEDKDPDRIDFKILLSTFILADLLGRFHDPPTKETELRDLYTDSTFLALVLLYGAATVPFGILLAVVELRPFALFFAIRVVTLFFSAFGWAHLSSTAYVLGPALVETKREKDLAGPMVGHGIVLGIFVGTLLLRLGTLELVEAMQ